MRSKFVLSVAILVAGCQNAEQAEEPIGATASGKGTARAFLVEPGGGQAMAGSGRHLIVGSGVADFSIFESQVAPGKPTPSHRHFEYDEGFLVLDGQLEVTAGDQTFHCGPGSFALVPRGIAHAFWNPGPGDTRMWVIGSSGVQALVQELAPMLEQSPPNMQEVIAAFARHKSELLITPPAAGTTQKQ